MNDLQFSDDDDEEIFADQNEAHFCHLLYQPVTP
jgi:hypothetical protein